MRAGTRGTDVEHQGASRDCAANAAQRYDCWDEVKKGNAGTWQVPAMPAEQFRIDYSLKLIDAFAPGGHEKGFARIARADVVDGLRDRIAHPKKQNQSAASLCGPAAFLYCVLEEHPEIYTQYVIDLYKTGEGRLGKLHVKPMLRLPRLSAAREQDLSGRLDRAGEPARFGEHAARLFFRRRHRGRHHHAAQSRGVVQQARLARRAQQYEYVLRQGPQRGRRMRARLRPRPPRLPVQQHADAGSGQIRPPLGDPQPLGGADQAK